MGRTVVGEEVVFEMVEVERRLLDADERIEVVGLYVPSHLESASCGRRAGARGARDAGEGEAKGERQGDEK
jgi:hypothetical protein